MHPDDAAGYAIRQGDNVVVAASKGSVIREARFLS
jgi:formylmethanofuran dehydrogenase subunit D